MQIRLERLNDAFHMRAMNEEGCAIEMDGSLEIGGNNLAMRPMQILLASLGGCSSIDVLMILKKKKQVPTHYEVWVDAEREQMKTYSLFKNIVLTFKIKGDIEHSHIVQAIELSLEKYCSVAKTLEPTATIRYKLIFNEE